MNADSPSAPASPRKSWVPMLLSIVFIVLVILVGVYAYNRTNTVTQTPTSPTPTPTATAQTTKTYTNTKYAYAVTYPSDWDITVYPDTGTGASFRPTDRAQELGPAIDLSFMTKPETHLTTPFADYVKVAATLDIQGYSKLVSANAITASSGAVGYMTIWEINKLSGGTEISQPITYFEAADKTGTIQIRLNDPAYAEVYNRMVRSFTPQTVVTNTKYGYTFAYPATYKIASTLGTEGATAPVATADAVRVSKTASSDSLFSVSVYNFEVNATDLQDHIGGEGVTITPATVAGKSGFKAVLAQDNAIVYYVTTASGTPLAINLKANSADALTMYETFSLTP